VCAQNPHKTDAIVLGTASRLSSPSAHDRHINIAGSMVLFVKSILIVGVTLDSSLTMNTAAMCYTYGQVGDRQDGGRVY